MEEANVAYEEHRKRMEPFPCAFNLVGADKVSTAKLRAIQQNIDSELNINDGCEKEQIIKRNLLTWVRFRLGKESEASELSRDVIESTKRRNVASLANCSFIMWQMGNEVEVMNCLKHLDTMKSENDFQTQLNDAQAEQAYYYSRLGGHNNLQRAIKLFCALPKTPVNYLRTFGLGLVYRRMTHINIVCSSPEHLTVEDYQKRAAECLFEVAEKADNRLRSLAYAQLANLRRNYQHKLSRKEKTMFRWLSVKQLCDKAMEHGQDIPTVLVQCGKAIKPIDLDKSIDWLSKSVALKDNSAAYHHLGICYQKKAEKAAEGQRCQGNLSENLRGRDCMDQRKVERHIHGQSNEVSGTYGSKHGWPVDGKTINQQVHNAPLREIEGHLRDISNPKFGSCRFGNVNYLPQNKSTNYGQEFQTKDVSNMAREVNEQHVASDYQYGQRHGQHIYVMDGCGYLRYQPPRMYKAYGKTRLQYMNITFLQTCDQTEQDGDGYIHSLPVERQYMFEVEEQWCDQNVQTDGVPSANDSVEILEACGPVHGGAVATSLAPEYSHTLINYEENHRDFTIGSTLDTENYPSDRNYFCIGNMATASMDNVFAHPKMDEYGESFIDMSEMSFQDYSALKYKAAAGTSPADVYERSSLNDQNLGFIPKLAEHAYDIPWDDKRVQQVQENRHNIRDGSRNVRKNRSSLGRVQSTSRYHCNAGNERHRHERTQSVRGARTGKFSRGRVQSTSGYNPGKGRFTRGSTQNFRGRLRPVPVTDLAGGHGQSMGSDAQNNNYPPRCERTPSHENWEPKVSLKGSVRRCRSVLTLNKDDENVQEARKCFEKAIDIARENLPAILDLGILLKDTKQIEEALIQFNSITNSINASVMNRVVVISAYEQAGLCFLELSRIKGNEGYKEKGKDKLTKAVGIAADLIHIMPELQGSHKEVWIAFTTLLKEIDKEQTHENLRLIKKFKILELAREYGDIIDGIQKLKETGHEGLTNPDIVKPALASFLQEKQPENALVYHNLVAMNPLVQDSDWWNVEPMRSLRIKVLLQAITGRLKESNVDNPTVLFQQLFEFIFGSCMGLRDPEKDQQTAVLGDVLFIFDSDVCSDEEHARCLKRLTTFLFGLEASENMQGTGEYGDRTTIQLKEMLNYQIVIIVLGNEKRDGYFNAMLQVVSYNSEKAPPNQKILVINTGLEDNNIPQCLKQYKSLKLAEIGVLADSQRIPGSWNDTDNIPYTDIIHHVFDGKVDVLKLFCFMIEQTWSSWDMVE